MAGEMTYLGMCRRCHGPVATILSLGCLTLSAGGGVTVVSPTDVRNLLRATPWLRKYGTLLAERLVQLGVSDPEQVTEVDRI